MPGLQDEHDYFKQAQAYRGYADRQQLGVVTREHIQRFAISVGDLNPLYFDEEYARQAGYQGIMAPPTYLTAVLGWEAGPPEAELRADGTAYADAALIPLPGARLMGGGQDLEFIQPVCPGDEVTMERRLVDVERREGRSGVLTLLKTEKRYSNQRGELLVVCRETLIVR